MSHTVRFCLLRMGAIAVWLHVAAVTAQAQSVRGTVVGEAGSPVPGVVVLLLDARDDVVARALTGENGTFRVSPSSSGSYRLRTMRIGFRSVTSDAFALKAGEDIERRIVLTGVPLSLDTVRVAGRNPCQASFGSGTVGFTIWEQARTALTAAQLTARTRAIGATLISYQRSLDPVRGRVLRQVSSVLSGLTKAAWTSPSADSLRRSGYVVSNLDGTTTYWAPDLGVLLSDGFVEDHCFRLAISPDDREVGIAFEPTRDRRGVSDIRGALWLDRRSAELRHMDFEYTNVSAEIIAGDAGGHMWFARARNGAWLISGWHIRMPVVEQHRVRVSGIRSSATTLETRLTEIRVEGGELALVTLGRDTVWAREPVSFSGIVIDSATGTVVPDARIALRGTAISTTSRSDGQFRLSDVLPGEYTVDVRTRALSAIGVVHSAVVAFTDGTTPLTIRVPSAQQASSQACGRSSEGVIAGLARNRDDSAPPSGLKVTAEWSDVTATGRKWGEKEARTDAGGAFRFCGFPLGVDVRVSAISDSSSADPVLVRLADERYAGVDLILERYTIRAGVLTGVVLSDIDATPIPEVEVTIASLARSAFTDERGRFRLTDVAAGDHVVAVRKVGYRQLSRTVSIEAGKAAERSLVLSRVVVLDTVSVTAGTLRDFEEHRRLGLGHFLTRGEIDALQGQPISMALRQMSGVAIMNSRGNQAWILSRRTPPQISSMDPKSVNRSTIWCPDRGLAQYGYKCGCYAKVYLDKQVVNAGYPTEPFDINSIPSASIEAVEWYSAPSQTPPEYNTLNSVCGVLVIHTRRSR
jgi:hypothetical protein